MAIFLKRHYDIIVLKTEMGQGRRSNAPAITFTLEAKINGQLVDVMQWHAALADLGFDAYPPKGSLVGERTPFRLPQKLVQDIASFFDLYVHNRPLWVHLVKPYGVLRYVPWERLLGDALRVPILMLPDFIFPRPRKSASAFEVALCATAPLGHEDHWIVQSTRIAARRILASSSRPIRLHVFVDGERAAELRNELLPLSQFGREIVFHDNATALKYSVEDVASRLVDQTGVLRSPWLLWMRDALRNRSVDVVHFACHGYLSRDRGAILMAQSPLQRTARYLAGPVGQAELLTFLTQVGAWSSVFTSLPDNNSEAGLRALADDIAQSRPGPLMMHTLSADQDGAALEEGYRFLYGLTPLRAPRSSALFIYCQPYLVASDVGRAPAQFGVPVRAPAAAVPKGPESVAAASDVTRNDLQRQFAAESRVTASALDPAFVQEANVAPWIASTERFAEQVQLRYQKLARDQLISPEVAGERMKLAMDTIGKLRAAVSDFSDPTGKPE